MTTTTLQPHDGIERLPRSHYARWLRACVIMAILGYGAYLIPGALFLERSVASWGPEALVMVGGIVSLFLMRADRVGTAAALMIFLVWTETHASILLRGNLSTPAILYVPMLVAAAGLIVGRRMSLRFALLTCISTPGAALVGRYVLDVGTTVPVSKDFSTMLTLLPTVMVSVGLVSMALRVVGDVVRDVQEKETHIREVLQNAPDGIVSLDAEGTIQSMNPAAERLLGGGGGVFVGRPLADVLYPDGDEEGRALVAQLVGERNLAPLWLTLRDDLGETFLEATSERGSRRDGSSFAQVVLRDVTARRLAEDRAGQLGKILQEAVGEVFILDPESDAILMASRGGRDSLGYETLDLDGVRPSEVNPALTPARLQELGGVLGRGEATVVSSRGIHRRRDGSVYPVETRIQGAVLNGRPVLVAFALDISERARAEEEQRRLQKQLEHAQRMEAVGQLAGGVAHDFNNLLLVVGGCAEILLEEEEEDIRELAGEIKKAQERGAALTKQLLAFARKEVVQLKVLDLTEVLPETRPLLERLVGEQVQLVVEVERHPRIVADQGQLEQVLLNLAANARDAMPAGGTVRLRAIGPSEGDDYVTLVFSDTGTGMDAETINRAFEPFFTSKPRGQGTGLGLATVHGIVTQNGGSVEIQSQPGKGTSFVMRWRSAHEEVAAEEPTKEWGELPRRKANILVVEDDDSARALVHLILEREGYDVVSASDADRGMDALQKAHGNFDLLLTDVIMPGRSGVELAEDVRRLHPELPILFMSGYLEDRIEAIAGVDPARDLILKPFRTEELRGRVGEALLERAPARG